MSIDHTHLITNKNTCWLFLAGHAEARHLNDIIFAITMLKSRGVSEKDIFIFTDNTLATKHFEPFGISVNIASSISLIDEIKKLGPYENLVMTVGGHGAISGIPVPSPDTSTPSFLSPTALIKCLRSCMGIKLGVLILTQCYAGAFNYMDAREAPPICIIGAAELDLSLSPPLRLMHPIKQTVESGTPLQEWNANIFMFRFFGWVVTPLDVDGDGKLSLMDAYKKAGSDAHSFLRNFKTDLSMGLNEWLIAPSAEVKAEEAVLAQIPDGAEKLSAITAIEAKKMNIRQLADILYINQVPWILNAHLARNVVFQI